MSRAFWQRMIGSLALALVASVTTAAEWMPLGVYSVLNDGGFPTSRFLRLSVSSDGAVRGTFFNGIEGTTQNLRGRYNEATGEVRWRLDSQPQASFRANIDTLMAPSGTIDIVDSSGQRFQWRFVRQLNAGWP